MVINGERVDADNNRRLEAINPYTGQAFGTIPDASAADVDTAIAAARHAFDNGWRATSGLNRSRLLLRLADLLDARAPELGLLESHDNGKLLRETEGQAHAAARTYRFFAGYADKLYGRTIPLDSPDKFDYTLREPVGVAALITAWNSPLQLLANKLAPALAAGNTVVVKPSEHASASTLLFADLVEEAGFPPGVVNIISGGIESGVAISKHRGIDCISFTGSVPTGQAIAAAASSTLVPVTLELGGKSPNIIFDDADLDRAIVGGLSGIFAAGGQTCVAGSRLLVQRSIYDRVVDELARRAARIRLGDPTKAGTQMGPVANGPQFERITRIIEAAQNDGARMVAGAQALADAELTNGLFVQPTIFADVDNNSALAREEIFGPVLSIIPFEDESEAVTIANDTEFGLAAGLWTNNLARAHRVADKLNCGTVWINTFRIAAAQTPTGGVGKSGYGRERGLEGLDAYLRTKNVMIDLSDETTDHFPMDDAVDA